MNSGRRRFRRHIHVDPTTGQGKRRPGREVSLSKPILGKTKIWFTRHCLDRMKQRGINESEVFAALRNPTRKGLPTQPHRERWRRNRSRLIAFDVVFERWAEQIAVVTVMLIGCDDAR